MSAEEQLELLLLSVVILPNLDSREYDVNSAYKRQLELFRKAAQPYCFCQEVTDVSTAD